MIYRMEWGALALIAKAFGKLRSVLVLGLAGAMLAGCMEIETIVRVNPDGSGTITERVVMSEELIQMISEMAPEGQQPGMINEQQLLDGAAKYGEGVEYVSSSEIATDFGSGYEATYSFTDINYVRVGQSPGENMPGGGSSEGGFTTFAMEPGYPAQLQIFWPVDEDRVESGASGDGQVSVDGYGAEQQEAAMEMMRMAFQDMRMAIHVEVAGQVIDSNATYLDGDRVTLVDIAFAEFLDSEEAMAAMAANKNRTVADMKDMLQLIPGLKLEIEPEIIVLFE